MEKLSFTSQLIRLGDLKGYDKNPRTISSKKKSDLIKSLQEFGLVELPVVDFDNTIIAGHQRISICSKLYGDDYEIEVRKADRKMTPKEFDRYNVISNQSFGEFDFPKLMVMFGESELLDLGFSPQELNKGKKGDEEEKKIELAKMNLEGFEKYDYLVFLFDSSMDFLNIQQQLGIEKVDYGFEGTKKIGLGRILKGQVLLDIIKEVQGLKQAQTQVQKTPGKKK